MSTTRQTTAVAVIPARWGSTRLPGKSLIPLCGKPMIQWVVESAARAKRISAVIVATDDKRIVAAVEAVGGKAVMTRSDHRSGTDRIAEAVAGMDVDVVINVQGDEPLIDPYLIDRLVEVMSDDAGWDMATAATRIETDDELNSPSVVKVVMGQNRQALYFSRAPIPFIRDATPSPGRVSCQSGVHWRHIGIYAYRMQFLRKIVTLPPSELEELEKLEQLRALHVGARIVVLEALSAGVGVDTRDDVEYVEAVLRRRVGVAST